MNNSPIFKFCKLHNEVEHALVCSVNYSAWQNLQTPAVHNVGSSTRCSCRGIQHFGQHLDQLSPCWNSNTVLLQTGLKDSVVGNMTTFLPRCRGEAV